MSALMSSTSSWAHSDDGFTLVQQSMTCSIGNKHETENFSSFNKGNWLILSLLWKYGTSLALIGILWPYLWHLLRETFKFMKQHCKSNYNPPWIGLGLCLYWKSFESKGSHIHLLPMTRHSTLVGARTHRRYNSLLLSTPTLTCRIQQTFPHLTQIYELLYSLGSDTVQKFHVSRALRSRDCNARFIFLLCRLSGYVSEPFRTRSQQQLKVIFKLPYQRATHKYSFEIVFAGWCLQSRSERVAFGVYSFSSTSVSAFTQTPCTVRAH